MIASKTNLARLASPGQKMNAAFHKDMNIYLEHAATLIANGGSFLQN
jgi:hypothetical protein